MNELEQFIKDHPPQPFKGPFVHVHDGLLEVCLEDVACYHEWIKGEWAEASVWRAMDGGRVVGVTIPYRSQVDVRLV